MYFDFLTPDLLSDIVFLHIKVRDDFVGSWREISVGIMCANSARLSITGQGRPGEKVRAYLNRDMLTMPTLFWKKFPTALLYFILFLGHAVPRHCRHH